MDCCEKVNSKESPSVSAIWKACATKNACTVYACDKIDVESCGWESLETAKKQCAVWSECAGFWYQAKADDHYWAMDQNAVDNLRDDVASGGYWLKEGGA